MTELLLEGTLSPQQRQYAEAVHLSSQALLSIINSILDISKIEAGKLELEIAPFSIASTAQSIVDLFTGSAQRKGLNLTCQLGQLPALLDGDSGRVRQILVNLVSNAIKFTDQCEVSLSIVRQEEDETSSLLYVEIRDNGIGIHPEAQAQVFERFYQTDGSMKRSFGGTGLGLTIARQLVELMGGSIGVTSELGKGSTFWFTVRLLKTTCRVEPVSDGQSDEMSAAPGPAIDQPDLRTDATMHASPGGTTCVPDSQVMNGTMPLILVVEDNVVNQKLIMTILKMMNYQVEVVSNGREAVEAWTRVNYDMLLMDGQMPVMDGFEATRIIREREASESRPRTTIIALTGQAVKGDRELFLAIGMDVYLVKPFTLQQIRALMKIWLPTGSGPELPGPT